MEPQENIAAYSKSYWGAEDCDLCGNNSAVDSVAGSEKHAHRNPMLDGEDEEVSIEVRWLDDANDPYPNHGHHEEFVGGVRRGCCSRRTRVVSAFGLLLLMAVAIVLGVTLSDVKEGKAGQSVSVQQQMLGSAHKGTATEVGRKGKEPKEPKQLKTGTTIAQRYKGIKVDPAASKTGGGGPANVQKGGGRGNDAAKEPKAPGKVIKEIPNEEVPFKWTGANGSRSRLRNGRNGSGPGVKGQKSQNDGSIASVPKGSNNKLDFDSGEDKAQKVKADKTVKADKKANGEVPDVESIKVVKAPKVRGVKAEKDHKVKADKGKVAGVAKKGAGGIAQAPKDAKGAGGVKAGKSTKSTKSPKGSGGSVANKGSGGGAANIIDRHKIHSNGRVSGYTVLGRLRPNLFNINTDATYTGPRAASLG